MIRFDGQVAIVTGAGRGLGREIALRLAARGAAVLVNDYGGGRSSLRPGTIKVAAAVADEITAFGGRALADGSDVAEPNAAAEMVARAQEAFGTVDILVNNAGGTVTAPVEGYDDAVFDGIVAANLSGPYRLIRAVWPGMKASGQGRIVNMLSSAMFGLEQRAAYAAAKAGLMALGAVAAPEGAAHGIRVNGLLPVVRSRLSKGQDDPALAAWMMSFPAGLAAEAALYLCSRDCVANGEMFSAGGGRVARNVVVNARGFRDVALSAESLAAHVAEVRDLAGAVPIFSAAQENALRRSLRPRIGTVAPLDRFSDALLTRDAREFRHRRCAARHRALVPVDPLEGRIAHQFDRLIDDLLGRSRDRAGHLPHPRRNGEGLRLQPFARHDLEYQTDVPGSGCVDRIAGQQQPARPLRSNDIGEHVRVRQA